MPSDSAKDTSQTQNLASQDKQVHCYIQPGKSTMQNEYHVSMVRQWGQYKSEYMVAFLTPNRADYKVKLPEAQIAESVK